MVTSESASISERYSGGAAERSVYLDKCNSKLTFAVDALTDDIIEIGNANHSVIMN